MARETDLTRLILEEAIKRWRRGTVKDELAPSLTVCLLGQGDETRWYVSLVRYVKRDRKRVERKAEAVTLEQALETLAVDFIPAGLDANIDHRAEMIRREPVQAAPSVSKMRPPRKLTDEEHMKRAREDSRVIRGDFDRWCGGQCGGAAPGCDACG